MNELQRKVNHLIHDVQPKFNDFEKDLVGISLLRSDSSENWIFHTDEARKKVLECVAIISQALEAEIQSMQNTLIPILEQEAKDAALQEEINAEIEMQRLEDEAKQAVISALGNKLKENMAIGRALINEYLFDNSKIQLSTQQTVEQLQKFSVVKQLLDLGSLRAAKDLIANSQVDYIFTQERKDKYLLLL